MFEHVVSDYVIRNIVFFVIILPTVIVYMFLMKHELRVSYKKTYDSLKYRIENLETQVSELRDSSERKAQLMERQTRAIKKLEEKVYEI